MVAAGAAILAAGLVVGFWLSRAVPPPDEARTQAAPVSEARAPNPSTPAAARPPATPPAPRAAIAANAAAYLAQRYAIDRTAAFDRLAASTDAASQAAAVDIADECAVFSDPLFVQTLANIDKRNLPAAIKAQQREMVRLERTRCTGFDTERTSRAARLRRALAKEGDPRMFVFGMSQGDRPMTEVIATAQRAAASGDPLAILQTGMFFAARQDVPTGFEYELGEGLSVSSGILRDAFWLAACDYGADCGAGSSYVATKCVGAGYCGSASLEELFIQYNYPPAEAERLQAARRAVTNGLRTGQWPANLWNPRR
jgi:hypothetical protein